MKTLLAFETNKYLLKLENFEGPLDLLCHLIDKNQMNISDVKIADITDQYISYINEMQKLNLDITSEFLVMASTLIYLKSKSLLPKQIEDEGELTEEELIYRIIEYKKYKEIIKTLREKYNLYSKRCYKSPDKVELKKRTIDKEYEKQNIIDTYKLILERNEIKRNKNAINIKFIAKNDNVTVASKVKDIFKELIKKPKFIFSKLCITNKYTKLETVTAFSGILELSKRRKISTNQEKNFGDIIVSKQKTSNNTIL